MAAAVNNIAATFSSSGGKISSKQPTLSTSASLALNNASVSSFSSSPIVAWNPQAKLPRSDRSSFVSLYGGPGPKHRALLNLRAKPLRSSPKPTSPFIRATISVGDKLPEATLSFIDHEDNLQTVTVSDLTRGKRVVLFAVPGAFTPTCSNKHLPGFVEKSDELKGKGVDTIACISVNDAFVMKAWGEDLNVEDKVLLLADGNGEFTKAMGVTLDFSDKPAGLGVRSRRYALLAVNGVVKVLKLEEGGAFTVSGAEDILKAL